MLNCVHNILILLMLQRLRKSDVVDIFGIVFEMRKERVWMVQTEQQYICIHQVINSPLKPSISWFRVLYFTAVRTGSLVKGVQCTLYSVPCTVYCTLTNLQLGETFFWNKFSKTQIIFLWNSNFLWHCCNMYFSQKLYLSVAIMLKKLKNYL